MLKWKWTLIAGLAIGAAIAVQFFGIRLGLDLRGGIHLVVRVQTDDAVQTELDDAAGRLRSELDRKKIAYASVDRTLDRDAGRYQVVIEVAAPEDLERVSSVVAATLREFSRSTEGNRVVASLPLNRVDAIREATVEQALTTIGERVNVTGVAEPIIQREGMQGSDRILIQLPGVEDPEAVKRLIGRVALLELKLVTQGPFPTREDAIARGSADGSLPPSIEVVEGTDPEANIVFYLVEKVPVVTGRDLSRAQLDRDELGQPAVAFTLNSEGARKFGEATGKNVGRQLAIVLDHRVKSAPVIRSRISDRGQIAGGFTTEEARELSLVLRAGALPAKIQYLEERTVGPFLGRDSIRKGFLAGIVGLALIAVCMVVYYRLAGFNAVVALVLNGVLLLGAVAALRATLTLPGIAGVILTLGMAVDANVLVFEAIRESLRNGVAPRRAIEEGFERAFSTILDSNLTTIGAALALWLLGSGPIRGFGVTLVIGLLISMFTAYFVSKTMFETFVLRREWKPGDSLSI